MNRILSLTILLAFLHAPTAALAGGPTSVDLGRELAELNCTACHNIEITGDSPLPEAPPFRTIPSKYDPSQLEEAFVEGIVVGHPAMPEWEMTPEQAAALAEYIASLAK
jgi:mono/diheme cytochrome c family protein